MSTDLFSWISGRDAWQQDLFLRICAAGRATVGDFAEIRALLEQAKGATLAVRPAQAVERSHLASSGEPTPPTVLIELGPVANVDRLAPGQRPIRFAAEGVTLVYGNNGSGKSGYCRIAKALCRCVHKGPLRSNAYEPVGPAPEVVVGFKASNSSPVRRTWRLEDAPPAELARLSVFDGGAAQIYVDGERKVEFLPHDLDLLARFTAALAELAETFRAEEAALRAAVKAPIAPGYTKGTPSQRLVERLQIGGSLPTDEELKPVGTWNEADERRLRDAYDSVRRGSAIVAKEKRDFVRRIRAVVESIDNAAPHLCSAGIAEFSRLRQEAERAAALAQTRASDLLSEGMPIANLGGTDWRRMLIYARRFAAEVAPAMTPPALARVEVCVLCQQTLDDKAAARMARFDTYLDERAAEDAEAARSAYVEAARAIKALVLPADAEIEGLASSLAALEGSYDIFGKTLSAFHAAARDNLGVLVLAIDKTDFSSLAGLDDLPERADESGVVNALEAEAGELDDRARSEDPAAAERLHEKLLDAKKLAREIEFIRTRRNQLVRLAHLVACREACDTTAATKFGTILRRALLTDSLSANFQAEVASFDLHHLPLRVRERGRYGESMVQIGLGEGRDIKVGDVLSEGEQRALALAGFLAELKEIGDGHGVIIDDPVSSLDHERIEMVARRLVEEGRHRQVIIFTHSLVFHQAVWSLAGEARVSVHREYVARRGDNEFGVIDDASAPWILKKTAARVEDIAAELRRIGSYYDHHDEACRKDVRIVYAMIRETWERMIEEVFFGDVIARFRKEVHTTKLVSVRFDDQDYADIDKGMTRASRFTGHDQALDGGPHLPEIDAILADVAHLRACYDRTRQRATDLKKGAKAAEDPPKPLLITIAKAPSLPFVID